MQKLNFKDLNLSPATLRAVEEMGFEEASPIQAAAIPEMLAGKDIIAQAQTGSGKTAAFAIPLIEKIDVNLKELQVLVMCPTRELVIQASEEVRKLAKYHSGVAVVPVYGGQDITRQLMALRRSPQVVIGTPGRLMDHMRRGSIKLNTVKLLVLDEADEMLDMGFRDDIATIVKEAAVERQTVMFSATVANDILKLMKGHQKNPIHIDVTSQKINTPKIEQTYYELRESAKAEVLARLIDANAIKLALVFCNTRMRVDNLVENLKSRGYASDGLHGDMSQGQRDKVMKGFRNGNVDILVATDVAGRGIDVNDVTAVFNYDLPRDDEDYVHRIGRTGRAGKSGKAFTFIVGREAYHLKRIAATNKMVITPGVVPSLNDLDALIAETQLNKIREQLTSNESNKYVYLAERLMGEDFTALDISAVLLKIILDGQKKGFGENVDTTVPAPTQERSSGSGRHARFAGARRNSGSRFGDNRGGDRDRSSRPARFGGSAGASRPYTPRDNKFESARSSRSNSKFVDNKPSNSAGTSAGRTDGTTRYVPKSSDARSKRPSGSSYAKPRSFGKHS